MTEVTGNPGELTPAVGSESSDRLGRLRVYAVSDGGECVWAITDDPEKARAISREYLRDSEHPEDYEGDDEIITELPMDKTLSLWWDENHISDGGEKLKRTCAEWIKDQGEGFLATTCI